MDNTEHSIWLLVERIKVDFQSCLVFAPVLEIEDLLRSKLECQRNRFDKCIENTKIDAKRLAQVMRKGSFLYDTVWQILKTLEAITDQLRRETVHLETDARTALDSLKFLSECAHKNFTPPVDSPGRLQRCNSAISKAAYLVEVLAVCGKISDRDQKLALLLTLHAWVKDPAKPPPKDKIPENIQKELMWFRTTLELYIEKRMNLPGRARLRDTDTRTTQRCSLSETRWRTQRGKQTKPSQPWNPGEEVRQSTLTQKRQKSYIFLDIRQITTSLPLSTTATKRYRRRHLCGGSASG